MDHIYPTKDYKVIKIKEDIEELSSSVLTDQMPSNFEGIATTVGISEKKLKEISLELCKSYQDYGSDQPSEAPHPFSSFPCKALELNCVKTMRDVNLVFKENKCRDSGKFRTETFENMSDLRHLKDSIITIRFYEPFKYTPSMKNQPRFHQEYQVLGSNFLSELRDKFYCHCNYGPYFDISDDPHRIPEQDPNQPNSGFFFIHDTFFNDTRNVLNADYSEVILNWFNKLHYVRDFKSAVMQDTKFEDCQIRIGNPCVYQHQGACEHIFCITSVDLVDSSNSRMKSDYPYLSETCRKRNALCDICGQNDTSFLVTNCALHVKDPMKVCESCFFSFHYARDGITKICEFNAYRMYSVRPENMQQRTESEES